MSKLEYFLPWTDVDISLSMLESQLVISASIVMEEFCIKMNFVTQRLYRFLFNGIIWVDLYVAFSHCR